MRNLTQGLVRSKTNKKSITSALTRSLGRGSTLQSGGRGFGSRRRAGGKDYDTSQSDKFLIGLGGFFIMVVQVVLGIFALTRLLRVENQEMLDALAREGLEN
mmetsp:Transcript_10234/g.14468  ORF Transcript_10234/g.14468 Transcript_10234/m.14468 type:complete len:102 (-) Transcript_10234:108-413(-)